MGPRVRCLGVSGLPMIPDLTVETFQGCVQPGLDFLPQRQGWGVRRTNCRQVWLTLPRAIVSGPWETEGHPSLRAGRGKGHL